MLINAKNKHVLGWLMFIIMATFYCYEFLLRVMPSAMYTIFSETMNFNSKEIGNIDGAYYWSYTPLQLVVGPLVDQYGVKNLSILAITLCVVGSFFTGFVQDYNWIIFGRFAIGFGSAFAFVSVLKIASVWLPKDYFSFVTGITTSLGMLGAIMGQVLITSIFIKFGVEIAFYITIIVGSVILIASALFIKDKPRKQSHKPGRRFKVLWKGLYLVGSNSQVILSGVIGAALFMPTLIFSGFWGRPFFEQIYHADPMIASLMTSLVFWGWIVGGPIVGYVATNFKRKRFIISLGSTVCALILVKLIYFSVTSFFEIYALMFLLGLFSSVQILVFSIAADNTPKYFTATSVAVVNMIVMSAGFLQPIIGRTLDRFHVTATTFSLEGFQQALIVLPACLILSFLLSFFIKDKTTED